MRSSNFDSDSAADPYDWDALARYLSGESSPEEANAVRAWLDARPERALLVTALRQSFDGLAADAAAEVDVDVDVDVEGALRKVHARIAESVNTPITPITSARPPQLHRFAERSAARRGARRWPVAGLVAAAAAVALVAIGVWRSNPHGAASSFAATMPAATYATAVGERDSVRLSDGSRVILGPSSTLAIASGYGATQRAVELHGEGYFDVVHDAARPFTVHTEAATIVDVGTTFTVRGDPSGTVRVAVTSGSVRLAHVTSGDSGIVLAAGDVGTLDPFGAATLARGEANGEDTAFTRGRLVFRDAPLARVAADVRRWYGIELRVGDSAIARRRLTATFDRETPEQAMAVIAAALGAVIERHGDTATAHAPPSRRSPNASRPAAADSAAAPHPR